MDINARVFVVTSVARCQLEAAARALSEPAALARSLRGRLERGDADSAGSTLRTIMVVAVVAAVVLIIGAAVRTAGSTAATCITSNGQNCPQ